MTVKKLIKKLKSLPQNAEVFHVWDGEPRTGIELVWLAKCGAVMTADYDQECYSDGARPIGAPSEEQDPYWKTTEEPDPYQKTKPARKRR